MIIDIITIFPKMFHPVLNESIIKRAQAKGKIKINIHDLRDYTRDKHRKVDDRPFGGGPGMLFRPEPIFQAVEKLVVSRWSLVVGGKRIPRKKKETAKIILLTPQGKRFNQQIAQRLSKHKHLIFICGHYEGVDERVRRYLADEEISIGDYVLTGGELPAMVFVDAVVRLIPGVLGKDESTLFESFSHGLLEYPQYTRPAEFRGRRVPEILLSGNHKLIAQWRRAQALKITKKKRPDLLK